MALAAVKNWNVCGAKKETLKLPSEAVKDLNVIESLALPTPGTIGVVHDGATVGREQTVDCTSPNAFECQLFGVCVLFGLGVAQWALAPLVCRKTVV